MHIAKILFFQQNQVKLLVQMPDPERCTTRHTPAMAPGVLRLLPGLAHHDCQNGRGHTFTQELECTEVPHLLEHVILELQALAQHHDRLCGETEWNWRKEPRGSFHVQIEFENEQLALACVRLAERLVNAAAEGREDEVDLDFELGRLRRLAELGEDLRGGPPPERGWETAMPQPPPPTARAAAREA
jgi:hypothetical protein